jgi:Monooxygenase af470-like
MKEMPIHGRKIADAEGGIVVFLIGARINKLRALRHWWKSFWTMPGMLRELVTDQESGMLGFRMLSRGPRMFVILQYWENVEKLSDYASDPKRLHHPAWSLYNRAMRGRSDLGVFHETYLLPSTDFYENIYVNMPEFGLGTVFGVKDARKAAVRRLAPQQGDMNGLKHVQARRAAKEGKAAAPENGTPARERLDEEIVN